MHWIRLSGFGLTIGLLGTSAIACTTRAQTPPSSAPPPQVAVVLAEQRTVALETRYTGRLESPARVELRPRLGGALDAVLFKEGAFVTAGTPLFRIDPRPYEIALRRAQAELATVNALLARARRELARAERLAAADAVSAEERERRQGEVEQLEARVASAEAAVADAALNLEWTVVRAPVSGRVGKAEVTAGNIVRNGPGDGTRLTTLQSTHPLHVYFDLDPETASRALAADRRAWRAVVTPLDGDTTVEGPVDFVDNAVGAQSGTLKVRATVPNPRGQLLPAAIVRVDFRFGQAAGVTVVPDAAISTDQAGRYVLVANAAGVLEHRPVDPGPKAGSWRVIMNSGVKPGEQVALPGTPGLRAGLAVTARTEVLP